MSNLYKRRYLTDMEEFFFDTQDVILDTPPAWFTLTERTLPYASREDTDTCLKACWNKITADDKLLSSQKGELDSKKQENTLLADMLLHFGREAALKALTESYLKEKAK